MRSDNVASSATTPGVFSDGYDSPESAASSTAVRLDEPLTGRLGRVPIFRTTTTGSLVGKFPLVVHREDGQTTWHTVLAFGSRAEQLQRRVDSGELIQGQEVDVVGYQHVNERPCKDGHAP